MSDSFQRMAQRLIDQYGMTVTLVDVEKGAFDPVSGGYGPDTETPYDVMASPPQRYQLDLIDGTLIQQGDLRLFVPGLSMPFVPELLSDKVTVAGETYAIQAVTKVYGVDGEAYYDLQLRA